MSDWSTRSRSHTPTFVARAFRSVQLDFSPIASGRRCAVHDSRHDGPARWLKVLSFLADL
jgi:hypothetical protein